MSSKTFSGALDAAGAAASLLCAIHCAALPLIVTLLPIVGLGYLASDSAEWTLLGLSAVMGVSSLCLGYIRTHRSPRALALLAFGLTLLALGHVLEQRFSEVACIILVVIGGLTVAASHGLNHALCRSCRRCVTPSKERNIP